MKTIICDIDGTITKYMGGGHLAIVEKNHQPLPGVVSHMRKWEAQGHKIILITGRRESVRERTESELRRLGIPFDILLMGYADGGKVLINDISPHVGPNAHVMNVVRDAGWEYVDWPTVGLDNVDET